ncbi:unnamed protein product [Colias eurytheme]|nr:unnamed protein product [Colias eurytheme]
MVNGNYVLYGDRPASESEIVDDHVHTRTVERKTKRKSNRSANDLQRSLNLAQKLDNETDADKYIKKIKEPRLLRYVPTTEVEENYVTEKFETYDLKPIEEPIKRYTFAKKPKNPSDGSVNYAYSRSSSSCSSPNGNLPTISEHGEQYGTYRIRSIQTPTMNEGMSYESKFDKYFARPRDVQPFSAKGSHPDSLYRVPSDGPGSAKKIVRVLRLLRWPVALFGVCVALAVFVYFLMPENLGQDVDNINATTWEQSFTEAHSYSSSAPTSSTQKPKLKQSQQEKSFASGIKVTEIDFYDAENDTNIDISSVIAETSPTRKFPIPPVYPTHIEPEVQYGNDEVDNLRKPKILEETSSIPEDSTLRPHITQKPEKPLAIYFKDVDAVSTSTERVTTEIIKKAESTNISPTSKINDDFEENYTTNSIAQTTTRPYYVPIHETQQPNVYNPQIHETHRLVPKVPIGTKEYYGQPVVNSDVKFTSGHSKLFGISIEDAAKMKATTQSSLYNTRVSPTLPTWRDRDDTTTKNYPINALSDVPQCRSTRLPLCRGILPYDLAGAPAVVGKKEVTQLLPQIEYLVATNCSERVRHFACALLEPECSPPPYSSKLPCYNLCKAIVDNCEGYIPTELNSMFSCNQYSSSNCASARAPCYGRELACGDGSCVPRDWVCDGTQDCPGGEDEAPCSTCEENEFRCSSGLCIVKRWVCDGYSDCPSGDDELDKNCYTRVPNRVSAAAEIEEPGEESAGSAPAPSIRKPNRLPTQEIRNGHYRNGESDSSKELLMTSDSTNSFKRNFTRRPSPSRLTPYSRPMPKPKKEESEEEPLIPGSITERPRWMYRKNFRKHQSNASEKKNDSAEDVKMDDLGVFGNIEKEGSDKVKQSMKPEEIVPATVPTRLDKSLDNLERVIDGAGLLRKAAIARKQEMADSPESNATLFETDDLGHNSAHASPCPNEELRCVDGRCITLSQLCDGTIDCSDHADEDNCYT